jgi:5-methylcytosine-specific restriction endonuclease McrA
MSILALDISGTPRQWISTDTAITYHATKSVAWSMGEIVAKYRGGIQNDGTISYIETPSIIAIKGNGFNPHKHSVVALSNQTLFGRDRYICAYCGGYFPNYHDLSRDHIIPKSRGGENTWMNVVTSCKICNSKKGSKTLKDSKMELLYLPYVPTHYENMILKNRNILEDQMEYLMSGVPKNSRVWNKSDKIGVNNTFF